MSELKVSDWSQKYKIGLFVLFFAFAVFAYFNSTGVRQSFGIAVTEVSYSSSSVTMATTTCSSIASAFLGVQTGRTSLIIMNKSTGTTQYVCKGTTCNSSVGIPLLPENSVSSGLSLYEQKDAYIGQWSCINSNGTTTIGWQVSQ